MNTAKAILEKVKALFNAPVIAPVAPAPAEAAAPAPAPAPAKTYKTSEGVEISIAQAGDVPAVGDAVTMNGMPAMEGVITLEDGSTITVDAAGKISAFTPAAPVTNDLTTTAAPAQAAPAVIAPVAQAPAFSASTPAELSALVNSFASGTPEERIAKLEVVCKALMETCMGYELREAERKLAVDSAIEIYKTDLKVAQAALAKQDEVIKGVFELCEELTKSPTADPATLTGPRKVEKVVDKREQIIEKFGAARAKMVKEKS